MYRKFDLVSVILWLAVAGLPAAAIDVEFFEDKVTTEELDNGLTILIYERPTAPVVSFFTHVDVGGPGSGRHHRPGAHVRAHGLQGHEQDRHQELQDAELKAMAKEDAAYAAYADARGQARRQGLRPRRSSSD